MFSTALLLFDALPAAAGLQAWYVLWQFCLSLMIVMKQLFVGFLLREGGLS